jgi:hypothetical protein
LNVSNYGFSGNQAIVGNGVPAPPAYDLPAVQGHGGAVYDYGSPLSLTGCTLTGNQAIGGSEGANPTFGNLSGSNENGAGGDILLTGGATVTVADSVLIGNVAQGGSSTAGTGGPSGGGSIADSNGIGGGVYTLGTLSPVPIPSSFSTSPPRVATTMGRDASLKKEQARKGEQNPEKEDVPVPGRCPELRRSSSRHLLCALANRGKEESGQCQEGNGSRSRRSSPS